MRLTDMLPDDRELEIVGNPNIDIDMLNLCNRGSNRNSILSYTTNGSYRDIVRHSGHIKALLCQNEDQYVYKDLMERRGGCLILTKNPEADFYTIHEYLCSDTDFYGKYKFPMKIGNNCSIHATAFIDNGVLIGNNVKIGAGTVVKKGSIIDDNTVIGCNSVIGSEGFQVLTGSSVKPIHATHVGQCHICSEVYVGDNTCICKSLFEGETYIGSGTKIDNLTQIAHNSNIGKNVVITAGVMLCGSVVIEDEVWIAPNASILTRVKIGKGAKVGLGAVVTKDVEANTIVYGNPAKIHG